MLPILPPLYFIAELFEWKKGMSTGMLVWSQSGVLLRRLESFPKFPNVEECFCIGGARKDWKAVRVDRESMPLKW